MIVLYSRFVILHGLEKLLSYTVQTEGIKIMSCPHISYLLIIVIHVIVICPRVANSSLPESSSAGNKRYQGLVQTISHFRYRPYFTTKNIYAILKLKHFLL